MGQVTDASQTTSVSKKGEGPPSPPSPPGKKCSSRPLKTRPLCYWKRGKYIQAVTAWVKCHKKMAIGGCTGFLFLIIILILAAKG